jgi:hypothetical protein
MVWYYQGRFSMEAWFGVSFCEFVQESRDGSVTTALQQLIVVNSDGWRVPLGYIRY